MKIGGTNKLKSTRAAVVAFAIGLCWSPGGRVARGEVPIPAPGGESSSAAEILTAAKPVDFAAEIHPILARSCAKCHAGASAKGGFGIEARENFIKGGDTGPAIIPGDPENSLLVQMIEGRVEGKLMPLKGAPLAPAEITLIRRWITEGAPWDEAMASAPKKPERRIAPLAPRRPDITAPAPWARSANPLDLILAKYWSDHGVAPPEPVSDAAFARRAWLDVVGLTPPADDLKAFVAAPGWSKRGELVDRLLADRRGYAENFMSFWNDMLRNDFSGTGYIDGGRTQITGWLFRSLAENKPYDQFVRELINPTPESAGFVKGIVWRGVVNSSQTPSMQASQNISQVFMGTNMKCASCHDSFINQWKLKDSYGLAAIFTDEPLEINHCDSPTGEIAKMKFLYPELGEVDPAAPRAERLDKLAHLMTKAENGRLARTIVNRLWARLLGRGLVEPLDDMDREAWSSDILDWLAVDLVDHNWDLKRTIRQIMTSAAYQSPAVGLAELETKEYVFRGPGVRRLSAEQLLDALGRVANVSPGAPESRINLASADADWPARRAALAGSLASARWVWSRPGAQISAPKEKARFRKSIRLDSLKESPVREAFLIVGADNNYVVRVNGKEVGKGKNWDQPTIVHFAGKLVEGENVIAVEAENTAAGPAGLIATGTLVIGAAGGKADPMKIDLATNSSWIAARADFKDWDAAAPAAAAFWAAADFWAPAHELGDAAMGPWSAADALIETLAYEREGRAAVTRTWLTRADGLQRALGRPNRDQVVTRRASAATTLQGLELTNGPILTDLVRRGAGEWMARLDSMEAALLEQPMPDPRKVVEELYVRAIGRAPSAAELEIAAGELQNPISREGFEDLLWALLNHPEFQLIY